MSDTTTVKIIDLTFDYSKPQVTLESDWFFLFGIILIIIIFYFLRKKIKENNFPIIEMEVEISGSPKTKFKAKRDDSNIYIANRIYIELITRKASLSFEDDKDVIVQVYDSWYDLFKIVREEVKNVPGHYLRSHKPTSALIGLSTRILNEGLRPHLTTYQAKYRKWYEAELKKESSKELTPQEIQAKYDDYDNLITDLKGVNKVLIDFSIELKKLIDGK
tara:strand:- start:111 stop:767 length:657 start_codon:yes stop_codon:yes gene_type:complete